ncbi:MAG: cytochrome c oxidase accessory protein CcoG, partial [Comamonas sp.]
KQFLWIAIALWTGFTFVGYFVPIRELAGELLALEGGWQIFWVLFYGFATYGNAGYMREQVCKYMCPYARFQSAMFDKDTLVVSYDALRGENRGPRKKEVDYKAQGLGDCIDCKLCVQVCPVGIDIRDGLQYECIGCGLCIDACNNVMDNMHYPRGLIRLTTENAVNKGWAGAQIWRRIARPRVLIYAAILLGLSAAMVFSMAVREPLKVDVIRDRASLARIAAGGKLENVYRLQVMNATEEAQIYTVTVNGLEGIELVEGREVSVDSAQTRGVAVRVQIPYGTADSGSHPIEFEISAQSGKGHVREKSVFLVPR